MKTKDMHLKMMLLSKVYLLCLVCFFVGLPTLASLATVMRVIEQYIVGLLCMYD